MREEAREMKEALMDASGYGIGDASVEHDAHRATSVRVQADGHSSGLSAAAGRPMPSSAPAPSAPPTKAAGAEKKKDVAAAHSASGTNNQVASVDEAEREDGRAVRVSCS